MRLRSLRLNSQPQLMIVPMIDIIFFLLVFFMMSTLYMVEQHAIPVNLPQAANAYRQEKPQTIAITVTKDGTVLVDDHPMPVAAMIQEISLVLRDKPDSIFLLRGDKETEYGNVAIVLDELKAAGAQKISVAAERKAR